MKISKQAAQAAKPQAGDKFILRFHDEGMRKLLKVRAAQNDRTLNAEILHLIKRGLRAEEVAQ